jgi:hypothetical protein
MRVRTKFTGWGSVTGSRESGNVKDFAALDLLWVRECVNVTEER